MSLLARELPSRMLRWEPVVATLLAWSALLAIPLLQGALGISWDMLNHHVYLGWTAETPRFDRDFLAPGYQAYQYPYLYWPVYKMATAGWSGAWAGVVLVTLQVTVVPAIWILARTCMPGGTVFDVAMRTLAIALALLTGVVLAIFDTTSNDLMAAVPLVWSLAFALRAASTSTLPRARSDVLLSGGFAGLSVAFKLSNGPLALLLPALWILSASCMRARLLNVALGCVATGSVFLLAYGYWGSLLWAEFGNPVFPFHDAVFAPLRRMLGGPS